MSSKSSKPVSIILNMTEGTFFRYRENYEKNLKALFEKDYFGTSRWLSTDKIIFVPQHLCEYVMKTYERVYP